MVKDYIKDNKAKKSSAVILGRLIIFSIIVFAVLLGKFALSGFGVTTFNGLPDGDAAYSAAKQFILPTVLSSNIKFSDSEYKLAKKSDSVYVIKSHYTTTDHEGDTEITNFTIYLKYNGGASDKKHNWALLNLDQNNH